jgi:hypothetical protein
MCRFFSGFFFRHPLLDGFDYYWRVEPAVSFTCDLQQDPFQYMQVLPLPYSQPCCQRSLRPLYFSLLRGFLQSLAAGLLAGAVCGRCMPINWYIDFVVCGHMYTQAF